MQINLKSLETGFKIKPVFTLSYYNLGNGVLLLLESKIDHVTDQNFLKKADEVFMRDKFQVSAM